MGSTERPIFVAKSVSKSKLSHYLAALATFIVGEGRELWAVKSYGAITQYGRSQRGGGQPAHSPLLFLLSLTPSSSHEGEGAMTGMLMYLLLG